MATPKMQTGQTDYVAPGSKEHAALLGLMKAPSGETLAVDGWSLADPLAFGPAATETYLLRILRSKVNELTGKLVEPQSEDRNKPGYAPKMWRPSDTPVSGII